MKREIFRIFKKISLIMLSVITCLSSVNLDVLAAMSKVHVTTIDGYGYKAHGSNYGSGATSRYDANFEYITVDGYGAVFCLEPWRTTDTGYEYDSTDLIQAISDPDTRKRIALIGYYGYQTTSKTNEDYVTSQLMIWEARGWTIDEYPGFYPNMKNSVNDKIAAHSNKPSFHGTNKEDAVVNTEIVLTDTNNLLSKFMSASGYPSENSEYDVNGVTLKWSGNNLYLTPTVEAPDNFELRLSNISSDDEGTPIAFINGNYQKLSPVNKVQDPSRAQINLKVLKYGKVNISKQDEDGTYIPGTSFTLSYKPDMSDPIGTYTTGEDGTVLVEEILPQKVYIQEVAVPDPLIIDNKIYEITIKPNDTVSYEASNIYKTGDLEITKMDIDNNVPVKRAGAEFDIYKSDGTFIKTISTNNQGVARLENLRWGDYYFLEKTPPTYYTKSDARTDFQIRENGLTVTKSFSNKRTLGTIEITKVDSETGNTPQGDASLDGAKYRVLAKENIISPDDGHVVKKANDVIGTVTIKDGKAKLEELYLGKYYIKEVQEGKGYLIDETVYNVTIDYTSPTKVVEVRGITSKEKVKKRAFELIKIGTSGDSGTTPVLKGAQFTVKLKSEVDKVGWDKARKYDVLTTDSKGYAKSVELPYGQYIVRETVVPENHNPVPDFTVNVNDDSREPIPWVIQNDIPFETLIGVVKLDSETGDIVRLEGAKFKIWNIDEQKYEGWWQWNPIPVYIDTFTTNKDGNVITPGTVRAGHYKLIEVESPKGYLLNRESKPFTIVEDGPHQLGPDGTSYITNITFSDPPAKGQLIIEKIADLFQGYEAKDSEFGKLYQPVFKEGLLAGVTYEIRAREDIMSADGTRMYYPKGTLIETLKTDGKKPTKSSRLPLGAYTVQEVKCDDPSYVVDTNVYEFDLIYKDQETATVTQTMKPYNDLQTGKAKIVKHIEDSEMTDNSEAYKNVKFGVYTAKALNVNGKKALDADKLIQIVSFDEAKEGNIHVDFAGEYYLKELKTDDQYVLSSQKYPFNFKYVGDKETVIKINNGNPIYNYVKRGRVEIQKEDSLTHRPLVNVWYELATDVEFKNVVKETCTDEKGKAIFEEVEKGKYYLRERYNNNNDMMIEGYVKDPTVYEVIIEDNEQVITFKLDNQPVRGAVTFTKTGETFTEVETVEGEYGTEHHPLWKETALLGSELTIYAAEDITTWDGTEWYKKDEAALTLESDWDTTRSVTLPVGKYYAKETKVPHGYIGDPTIYKFEIIKNGSSEIQLNPISINNNRAKVNLKFVKSMEEQDVIVNPEAYKDVVFGLYAREDIYDYMGKVAIKNGSLIGTSKIDEKGHLEKTFDLPIGVYFYKEIRTNEQYVLLDKEYDFEIAYQGSDVKEYTVDIHEGEKLYNYLIRGSVEILKIDKETKKPLVNVRYQLATDKEFKNILKETATGEDGKAIFEELERGTYYIRERYDGKNDMVIEGYVKDDTIHEVVVNEDKQVIKINATNQPVKGTVSFTKKGETFTEVETVEGEYGTEHHPLWKESFLLGSELTIYAAEDITTWDGTGWYKKDEAVLTLESDWETVESIKLPVGNYYAKETKVPHGYIGDETVYEFEIIPNGKADIQLNPISIYNDRAKVKLKFVKSMEEQEVIINPEAYKDVVFGLYAREDIYDYMGKVAIKNGSLIGTSKIDKKGHLEKTFDLPIGVYYYKELSTNEQYVLLEKEYDFEIAYQGSDVKEYTVDIHEGEKLYNYLIRGSVEILKVDKETEKPLVNVGYQLATDKEFKNILKETATGEDGKAIFEELERGTYYIRERYDGKNDMVIEGYVKDDTIHEVTVNEDKQVIKINATNQPVKGTVSFTKKGETFTEVETVEGEYGTEHHPLWKESALLGSELTIYAAEDITTWDGTEWYKKDEVVLTLESDWETVESIKLPVGNYYAKETKVPHGYIADETVYKFEIVPNGKADIQLNPISIYNDRAKVNFEFKKVLETQEIFINSEAYKDVVYGLYAREDIYDYMGKVAIKNGSLIGTSGIDEKGQLLNTFDLPNGVYYYKEIATNDQYVLSQEEYDFEISYQGQNVDEYTVEINDGDDIENTLIRGTIEVIKYTQDDVYYNAKEKESFDFANSLRNQDTWRKSLLQNDNDLDGFDYHNYLYGVTFELATDKAFTNIIHTGSTDLDGRLVFDELERGTYFIREKESLDYYELNRNVFEVTIERDGQFETVGVDNNLISSFVMIEKVDADNLKKRLGNAVFTLYADEACTQEIDKQTTNEYGVAMFTNIKFGTTVYIKETVAPEGYHISPEVFKIVINESWIAQNNKRTLLVKDEPIKPVQTGDHTDRESFIMMLGIFSFVTLASARKCKKERK